MFFIIDSNTVLFIDMHSRHSYGTLYHVFPTLPFPLPKNSPKLSYPSHSNPFLIQLLVMPHIMFILFFASK